MSINLSALSPITTKATGLSGLILATPQENIGYQPQLPPNKDGEVPTPPPTLVFNYEGEQTATLESDITDHYVEDNTAIADQIALKPEIITTAGYVGELNDVVPDALRPLKLAADKLTPLVAYTPALTEAALVALQQAQFLYQTGRAAVDAGVAAWSSITGGNGEQLNKQQRMFQQFYGYWRSRTLFTVQTPWAVFNDCAIQSLKAVQDEETRTLSTFEVTFKKMRFAETLTIGTGNLTLLEGRAAAQGAGLVDMGVTNPVPDINLSSALSGVA